MAEELRSTSSSDTGVLADDRFFDVVVEYAKAGPEDIVIQIGATNRGPDPAPLHLLPTLWYRNTWSWGTGSERPSIVIESRSRDRVTLLASHARSGELRLAVEGDVAVMFTDNETNVERLFGVPNAGRYVKDAFHAAIVDGRAEAVNPDQTGSKAAAHPGRLDRARGDPDAPPPPRAARCRTARSTTRVMCSQPGSPRRMRSTHRWRPA